jgi:hypothetical protein
MDVIAPNNYGRYKKYLNQVQGFMGRNWSQEEIIVTNPTSSTPQQHLPSLQIDPSSLPISNYHID